MAYFLPILQAHSSTLDTRVHYLVARTLPVCFGAHRATSGALLFAEEREPAISVLRKQELFSNTICVFVRVMAVTVYLTCFFRSTQFHVYNAVRESSNMAPYNLHWFVNVDHPPWTLPLPEVELENPCFTTEAAINPIVLTQLSLSHFAPFTSTVCTYGMRTYQQTAIVQRMVLHSSPSNQIQISYIAIVIHSWRSLRHTVCNEHIYHSSAPRSWVFLTDSQVTLRSLQSNKTDNRKRAPLVYRIVLAYSRIIELHCTQVSMHSILLSHSRERGS